MFEDLIIFLKIWGYVLEYLRTVRRLERCWDGWLSDVIRLHFSISLQYEHAVDFSKMVATLDKEDELLNKLLSFVVPLILGFI